VPSPSNARTIAIEAAFCGDPRGTKILTCLRRAAMTLMKFFTLALDWRAAISWSYRRLTTWAGVRVCCASAPCDRDRGPGMGGSGTPEGCFTSTGAFFGRYAAPRASGQVTRWSPPVAGGLNVCRLPRRRIGTRAALCVRRAYEVADGDRKNRCTNNSANSGCRCSKLGARPGQFAAVCPSAFPFAFTVDQPSRRSSRWDSACLSAWDPAHRHRVPV
jgi:hypothetical protein